MLGQNFEWTCPRQECGKRIAAFTDGGMKALRDQHISQHVREDRAAKITKIEDKTPETPKTETAMVVFRERDYDILELTRIDIGFLKTRGIARDTNMVLYLEELDEPAK